jgi:hypothetical protein
MKRYEILSPVGFPNPAGDWCKFSDVTTLEQSAAQLAEALGIAKCRIERELDFNHKNNYPTTRLLCELAGIESALAAYRELLK